MAISRRALPWLGILGYAEKATARRIGNIWSAHNAFRSLMNLLVPLIHNVTTILSNDP